MDIITNNNNLNTNKMVNKEELMAIGKRTFELGWFLRESINDESIQLSDLKEEVAQLEKDINTLLDTFKDTDPALMNSCLDIMFELNRAKNLK